MNDAMKASAKRFVQYLRVSTNRQDTENQNHEILKWANRNGIILDEKDSIKMEISSKRSMRDRGIDDLLSRLQEGDCLVVAELSRLGRSLVEIISICEALTKAGRGLICLKEHIEIIPGEKMDLSSKMMISMFGMFAELERTLIGLRTSAAIQKIKDGGGTWGRRPGVLCKSKVDPYRDKVIELMELGVSYTSIGKIIGIKPQTLHSYIQTRKLKEEVAKRKKAKEAAENGN